MSRHIPILMTIREELFKNYRSRTSEKWKAKEDKIEEAKKQKIKRSDDEWSYDDWQQVSWSWQQPMTWISSPSTSWQQWSSDQRVSLLIGNHQPIGAARTKRVIGLDGDHRVPGSRRSYGSEGPHLRRHQQGHS